MPLESGVHISPQIKTAGTLLRCLNFLHFDGLLLITNMPPSALVLFKYHNVCVSCTALYFVLPKPSQCGTTAELWHCPLTARGLIVKEDTDSGQSQLCRGLTE